jgi:hypothetical protein
VNEGRIQQVSRSLCGSLAGDGTTAKKMLNPVQKLAVFFGEGSWLLERFILSGRWNRAGSFHTDMIID